MCRGFSCPAPSRTQLTNRQSRTQHSPNPPMATCKDRKSALLGTLSSGQFLSQNHPGASTVPSLTASQGALRFPLLPLAPPPPHPHAAFLIRLCFFPKWSRTTPSDSVMLYPAWLPLFSGHSMALLGVCSEETLPQALFFTHILPQALNPNFSPHWSH